MKKEDEIYAEYNKYSTSKPLFFGKDDHWKSYYEGYEMGYQDAAKESLESFTKEVDMDPENFPTEVDEQFDVMKKALKKYYQDKTNIDLHTSKD